jgi:hypothetical protein
MVIKGKYIILEITLILSDLRYKEKARKILTAQKEIRKALK